jgi:hypothetical protein
MLRRADWWIVADVSEDSSAFIFSVKQPKKRLGVFNSEDEDFTVRRNVGNYLPTVTA